MRRVPYVLLQPAEPSGAQNYRQAGRSKGSSSFRPPQFRRNESLSKTAIPKISEQFNRLDLVQASIFYFHKKQFSGLFHLHALRKKEK